MIEHDELVELLAATKASTTKKVFARIAKILTLAKPFRRDGAKFTFADNPTLDREVRTILVELSDELYLDIQDKTMQSVDDEDRDAVWSWVVSTQNPAEYLDKYCSHLYYILEGWIAIAFANMIGKAALYTDITTYLDSPYTSPLWVKAFQEGQKYAADIISSGGYRWGKGEPINPVIGLAIVQNSTLSHGFHFGSMLVYGRKGAIGYRVHRGSDYDCPTCDEACIGIHPLDDLVVPLHPNCVCYTTPVFPGEE